MQSLNHVVLVTESTCSMQFPQQTKPQKSFNKHLTDALGLKETGTQVDAMTADRPTYPSALSQKD